MVPAGSDPKMDLLAMSSDDSEDSEAEDEVEAEVVDAATASRLVFLRGLLSGEGEGDDARGQDPSSMAFYGYHEEYVRLLSSVCRAAKEGGSERDAHNAIATQLRKARERFASFFPLSADHWVQWVQDEKLLQLQEQDQSKDEGDVDPYVVEEVAKRGLEDNPAEPDLWLAYASSTKTSTKRKVFEEACQACGTHVKQGSKVWQAYVDFLLRLRRNKNNSGADEANAYDNADAFEGKGKGEEDVRKVFQRAMRVPLEGLDQLYEKYCVFEKQSGGLSSEKQAEVLKELEGEKRKSQSFLQERASYENGLLGSQDDTSVMGTFQSYLKYENKYGDPTRVISLFERLVSRFPCYETCWDKFGSYVESQLKNHSFARKVYWRGVRNCGQWSQQLWLKLLRRTLGDGDVTPEEKGKVLDLYNSHHKNTTPAFDLNIQQHQQHYQQQQQQQQQEQQQSVPYVDAQQPQEKQNGKLQKKKKKRQRDQRDQPQRVQADAKVHKKARHHEADDTKATIFRDECTLFVKNLPFNLTCDALAEHLGGDIVKECRIVYDKKTGNSKGFAYVDFNSEEHLQKALEKDGTELQGRTIVVAKSKPRKKFQGFEKNKDAHRKSNVDLKSKGVQPMAFLPRGLAKKAAAAPKSNEDFRKMLLKK